MEPEYTSQIPEPKNWFESKITYSGIGTAQFATHDLSLEGDTEVHFDERCRPTIILKHKHDPDLSAKLKDNTCTSLTISCENSILTVPNKAGISFHDQLYEKNEIVFTPSILQFKSHLSYSPKYWVLPLFNFISAEGRRILDELNEHPLRLYEPWMLPEGLSDQEWVRFMNDSKHTNHMITFDFGGSQCFIERLPDCQQKIEKIKSWQQEYAITALMIGDTPEVIDLEDIENILSWGPMDFENWLFLATGTRVLSPWIEFRDAKGNLVSRIHFRNSLKGFQSGQKTVEDFDNLLTKAAKSERFHDINLKSVLYQIAMAGQDDLYLEDRKASLFRAADTLTKDIRLKKRPLPVSMEQEHQIKEILVDTASKIEREKPKNKSGAQAVAIQNIANRVKDADKPRSLDDAEGILTLADKFGLHDRQVIETVMTEKLWKGKYKNFRGVVIHEGYFDLQSGKYDMEELVQFMKHLHDLLIRLVLKMINYDGFYSPTIHSGWKRWEKVDWVQSDTPASKLGYKNSK